MSLPRLSRHLVRALLLVLLGALSPELVLAEAPVPVIDLHVDLPYRSGYAGGTFEEGSGQFRATDLVPAGLRGVVLPLYLPKDASPEGRTEAELERSYARVFGQLLRTPPYSLPGCGVRRAGGSARGVETWLAFEGAGQVEPDQPTVRQWLLRGVRVFGLVHSEHNSLATSSGEPSARGLGLTERGRRFVKVVQEAGGIIDVSHASDAATDEVLDLAEQSGVPVVATHSNARALADHPRNLTDEQIRRIGRSGGVVGVNFHGRFLEPKSGRGTTADVVAQVEHIARVGGDASVAIGSDFEGGIRAAAGLEDATRYRALGEALAKRGHARGRVAAFFSDNARRVLCRAH